MSTGPRGTCCGETLHWLVAEASWNGGCHVQLWRCRICERVTRTGWRPPTAWGPALSGVSTYLRSQLRRSVANAYPGAPRS